MKQASVINYVTEQEWNDAVRHMDAGRRDMIERNRYGMSPWGSIHSQRVIAEGFKTVSTGSHGGWMLSADFVSEHNLSAAARTEADSYLEGNTFWLCYEEDCRWAIPAYELLDAYTEQLFGGWNEAAYAIRDQAGRIDPERIRQYLWSTLSAWEPEYLLARGIAPHGELYNRCLEGRAALQAWQAETHRRNAEMEGVR